MKLLLIEDDPAIVSFLTRGLTEEGHTVESSTSGDEGLYRAQMYRYDVILLDWMLPEMSGTAILDTLRREGNTTPVLMLTARGTLANKVEGFQTGADDYLTKPFAFEELLVRIEALHRRTLSQGVPAIHFGDITLDLERKQVTREGKPLKLTRKEYELLLFLYRHINTPVSATMIEEQLWGDEALRESNVIAVTMYHLRQKIGKDRIRNERGIGYTLEA